MTEKTGSASVSVPGLTIPEELPLNAADFTTVETGSILAEVVAHTIRQDSKGGDTLVLGFMPTAGQTADNDAPVPEAPLFARRSFNGGAMDITMRDLKVCGWIPDAWDALVANDIGLSGMRGKQVRLAVKPESYNGVETIKITNISALPVTIGQSALDALRQRAAGAVQATFFGGAAVSKGVGGPKKGNSPPPAVHTGEKVETPAGDDPLLF